MKFFHIAIIVLFLVGITAQSSYFIHYKSSPVSNPLMMLLCKYSALPNTYDLWFHLLSAWNLLKPLMSIRFSELSLTMEINE